MAHARKQDFNQRTKMKIFRKKKKRMKIRRDENEMGKTEAGKKIWVRDGENKEEQKRGSQWEERVGYESSLL